MVGIFYWHQPGEKPHWQWHTEWVSSHSPVNSSHKSLYFHFNVVHIRNTIATRTCIPDTWGICVQTPMLQMACSFADTQWGGVATNCALCVPRGRSQWGGDGSLYLGSHWELCSEPWVISHNSGGHHGRFVCSSTIRHTCHTWESRKHTQWQLCECTPSFELAPSMIKRQRRLVNAAMHIFIPLWNKGSSEAWSFQREQCEKMRLLKMRCIR